MRLCALNIHNEQGMSGHVVEVRGGGAPYVEEKSIWVER